MLALQLPFRCISPYLLYLGIILEGEGDGVEAVAEVSRCWTIIEDMTEMATAAGAEDFGANHAEGDITDFGDVFRGEGAVEAGPASAGVELRAGGEEGQSATCTEVDAIPVVIQQVSAEGGLGSFSSQNAIGGSAKLFLPLRIGLHDAGTLHNRARLTIGANQAYRHGVCVICEPRGGLCGHAGNHRKQEESRQEMT